MTVAKLLVDLLQNPAKPDDPASLDKEVIDPAIRLMEVTLEARALPPQARVATPLTHQHTRIALRIFQALSASPTCRLDAATVAKIEETLQLLLSQFPPTV